MDIKVWLKPLADWKESSDPSKESGLVFAVALATGLACLAMTSNGMQ